MAETKDLTEKEPRIGDFIVVAEILDIKSATLRARFRRNNIETISIMKKYLKEKTKLKKKLQHSLV
ncbi:hypothetical protein OX283_004825 [Flavobacterium sp. SUN052]|uniref:hypothetical protein n=1 Tax=Flavobacterium sp. SUN052 TaxID=3002441 RepID=UPI00237EDE12|nr:hypothetical protein [Flavobacterium sp. SUN052]MEC4003970.1 hypothetical protein [Flavobacterium sp. SUN052]